MFFIDIRSRIPIYEQLVKNIQELIMNKVLQPDEQLPPVRSLATTLTVNPNTIQKAYKELELLGFIYSVPGKGSFVSPYIYDKQIAYIKNLKEELVNIVIAMHKLGLHKEEIYNIIDEAVTPLEKEGN